MFESIFHEYMNLRDALFGDDRVLLLRVVGNGLIAVTFIILGACVWVFVGKAEQKVQAEQLRLSRLFGLFLVSCGSSRAFNVYCFFHSLQVVNGLIEILTGTIALMALIYVPFVIRAVRRASSLSDVHDEQIKIREKMETLTRIKEELDAKESEPL